MKKYKITATIEKVVEANNKKEAKVNFWNELGYETFMNNLTTDEIISDNMKVVKINNNKTK